jgi:hypothetical protein
MFGSLYRGIATVRNRDHEPPPLTVLDEDIDRKSVGLAKNSGVANGARAAVECSSAPRSRSKSAKKKQQQQQQQPPSQGGGGNKDWPGGAKENIRPAKVAFAPPSAKCGSRQQQTFSADEDAKQAAVESHVDPLRESTADLAALLTMAAHRRTESTDSQQRQQQLGPPKTNEHPELEPTADLAELLGPPKTNEHPELEPTADLAELLASASLASELAASRSNLGKPRSPASMSQRSRESIEDVGPVERTADLSAMLASAIDRAEQAARVSDVSIQEEIPQIWVAPASQDIVRQSDLPSSRQVEVQQQCIPIETKKDPAAILEDKQRYEHKPCPEQNSSATIDVHQSLVSSRLETAAKHMRTTYDRVKPAGCVEQEEMPTLYVQLKQIDEEGRLVRAFAEMNAEARKEKLELDRLTIGLRRASPLLATPTLKDPAPSASSTCWQSSRCLRPAEGWNDKAAAAAKQSNLVNYCDDKVNTAAKRRLDLEARLAAATKDLAVMHTRCSEPSYKQRCAGA